MDKNAIKKCILDYFDIIYSFEKIDSVYLIGGAIRDIFLNNNFKDLDFVCTCDEKYIIDFINNNNLKYKKNSFGGYKISYLDIEIDMWSEVDLFNSIEYNLDGIVYNIGRDEFIYFGFYDAIENGLKKINFNRNLKNEKRIAERKQKLEYFLKIYKEKKETHF